MRLTMYTLYYTQWSYLGSRSAMSHTCLPNVFAIDLYLWKWRHMACSDVSTRTLRAGGKCSRACSLTICVKWIYVTAENTNNYTATFCMLRATVCHLHASLDNCLSVNMFRRSLKTDLVGQWYTSSGSAAAALWSDAGLQNVTTYLLIYS